MHVTIAMLTYRRNEYLAQVIPHLLEQVAEFSGPNKSAGILIIDNDPQGGARAVVESAQEVEAAHMAEQAKSTGVAPTGRAFTSPFGVNT